MAACPPSHPFHAKRKCLPTETVRQGYAPVPPITYDYNRLRFGWGNGRAKAEGRRAPRNVYRDTSAMWAFCRTHGCLRRPGDERPYTVLMYDGGSAYVDDARYDGFLWACAQDVPKVPLFVSEQRSPVYRFFIDHDCAWYPRLGERPMGSDGDDGNAIVKLVAYYQRCIRMFYQDPSAHNAAHQYGPRLSSEELDEALTAVVLDAPLRTLEGDVLASSKAVDAFVAHVCESSPPPASAPTEEEGDDRSNDTTSWASMVQPPQSPPGGRQPYIKQGLHIVFPGLLVDDHQALTMRETFVENFGLTFAPRHPAARQLNPVAKIVDPNVYITNGLRMAYSGKVTECSHPHRKGDSTVAGDCTVCNGTRNHYDMAHYRPTMVVAGDGRLLTAVAGAASAQDDCVPVGQVGWPERAAALVARLQHTTTKPSVLDIYAALRLCSIRAPVDALATSGWWPYEGHPRYDLCVLHPSSARRYAEQIRDLMEQERISAAEAEHRLALAGLAPKSKRAGGSKQGGHRGRGGAACGSKKLPPGVRALPTDDTLAQLVANLVHTRTLDHYREVEISALHHDPRKDEYIVDVTGPKSRYCINVGRSHNRATVYFRLNRDGIFIGCRCQCAATPERHVFYGVPCSAFHRQGKVINTEALAHIYPDLKVGPVATAGRFHAGSLRNVATMVSAKRRRIDPPPPPPPPLPAAVTATAAMDLTTLRKAIGLPQKDE